MIDPHWTYAHLLAVGLSLSPVMCSSNADADTLPTAAARSAWGETFPLKQSRDESRLRDDSHREGPPASELSLIERETAVPIELVDPLHAVVQIAFPEPEILTIGDAATALLAPLGYELLDKGSNTSELLGELLQSPLPAIQRRFHDVRASEVLRALAGVGFIAVVDHVRRRVTFDPMPLYRTIGGDGRSDKPSPGNGLHPSDTLVPVQPTWWQAVPSRPTSTTDWVTVPSLTAAPIMKTNITFGDRVRAIIASVEKPDRDVVSARVKSLTLSREEAIAREAQLRGVAQAFRNDAHLVTITSCVDDNEELVERRQARLLSAMVRLGVPEQSIRTQTPACGAASDTPPTGSSDVALTRLATTALNSHP